MYQNVSVPYCPFYRPFHDQISAHGIKRFTNNATGLIPPLSLCREAGGNRCSCRDAHPFPLLLNQPRKPGHPLVFPPQGCLKSFATHDLIESAPVHLSALSIAGGSLEVTRSQVVFHFHLYFLLCHRGEEHLCRQR